MAHKGAVAVAAIISLLAVSRSSAKVEHHTLISTALAATSESSRRELSVYVPDGSPVPVGGYPVFYLLHGYTGSNRTFLGEGYPSFDRLIGAIRIDEIMDGLISSGVVHPMMVVLPNLTRSTSPLDAFSIYVTEEILAFVDAIYPTQRSRQYRAIGGHSVGGSDAVHMALSRSDLFCLVAGYSPYFQYPIDSSLFAGFTGPHPVLRFWLYAGDKDRFPKIPRETRDLVSLLNTSGLPCVRQFDRGNHWDPVERMITESLVYFDALIHAESCSWAELKVMRR